MALTLTDIGVGTVAGDGTGDTARVGGQAINANNALIEAAVDLNTAKLTNVPVATDPIWDAAGDLAVGTGADTAAKLAIGTTLQVLRVNAGVTALEWAEPGGGGAFTADGATQITPSTAIVLAAATGDEDALRIDYTTNKATSGDDTGLVVNQTDTASPGVSLLADFQVGGVSRVQIRTADHDTEGALDIDLGAASAKSFISLEDTYGTGYIRGKGGSLEFGGSASAGVQAGGFHWDGGVIAPGNKYFGWCTAGSAGSLANQPITRIYQDVNYQLDQRNGTNPNRYNIYGDYASATDYQRNGIVTSRTATTVPSAASFTLTGFIPVGALLLGITSRVDTTCTTATGYTVGDGSDVDLWGVASAVAVGTATGSADFTAAGASGTLYTAAQDVVVTSTGGNFDGTGVITVCAHYIICEAD